MHMWRKIALGTLMLVALAVWRIQPVQTQNNGTWDTEFYNNIYLIGPSVSTRQDSAIAFDWDTNSPVSGVNADYFSVRWASDPYFEAGTYRFYALTDDTICIWVDFQPLLDTFTHPRIGETLSADVVLSAGIHHIQVDYRENWGNAYIFVTWANLATNPGGPNFPKPVSAPSVIDTTANYWTAQYYNNSVLAGMPVDVMAENSSLIRNWGYGSPFANIPVDNFSVRWTGLQQLNAGIYRITARVDDGVRVYVDGTAVINEYHLATGNTYITDVYLAAGQHNLMVEYYEATDVAWLEVAITPITIATPTSVSVGTLRVTASVLNVRQSPTCDSGVMTKVGRGESYSIVGRNADSSWWQINVNGSIGWVFGRFTEVFNTETVPITDVSSCVQLPATGYTITATATAIIRSKPGNRYAYLGYMPRDAVAEIVGRNLTNTWWQVNYTGVIGWVSASVTSITPTPDITQIPVRS